MLKASSNWCCFPVLCSLLSGNSCFTKHRTLWVLNHVYGSRKRPSAYYTWNKRLKGQLGRHKVFIISVLLFVFGETSDVHTLLLQTCQAVLEAPQKCHQKFCCSFQEKWVLARSCALASSWRWGITRLSVGPKSPLFSCRQTRQQGLSCQL